jgi:hypothetical protein
MEDEYLFGGAVYRHSPLAENDIRILVLLPSTDRDAPLQGRIEHQSINALDDEVTGPESQGYEAISYTWGTNEYVGAILVHDTAVPIPPSLKLALLRIRDHQEERRLWVDSVCINMQDLRERRHQILKIRQIFQGATRVLVWLGEESEESLGALQFLEKAIQFTDMDEVLRGNTFASEWKSVRSILLSPYFTRIWVVPEVAVARRATLLHGSQSIDWKVFEAAITIFDKRWKLYPTELPGYHQAQLQGASQFLRTIRRCFHRDGFGNPLRPALSLETLVFELSGAKASDPRDKIYALLAIASDIDPRKPEIEPDYDVTSEHVYLDFYRFCLTSKGLDVVLRPLVPTKSYPTSPWLWEGDNSELAVPLIEPPGLPQHHSTGDHQETSNTGLAIQRSSIIVAEGFIFARIVNIGVTNDIWKVPVPRSWLTKEDNLRLIEGLLSNGAPDLKEH